jgi:serine phosphatase RsbU (regulator of sigma subunit)
VYVATDGLFDQVGGAKSEPIGYKQIQQIILDNHHEPHSVIAEKIWNAFERHRGKEVRVDDVEMIGFTKQ